MCHPRYCLTHHPGISSNITNATHFITPAMSTTLAHRPLYPRWCTAHAIHAGTSPQHPAHITHASTSPTLARHQRKHTTHISAPLTQARHPRHSRQHKQHAISQTPGYPIKLLKLLGLKFQEGIQQLFTFNFYFCSLYFLGLFKHFHRSLENCHRKIKLFQRKLVCLIQKATIFSKTNAQLFQRKLFPNISAVLAIVLYNSLRKMN